ncbi:DNA-binding protein [Streptomyces sp. NBC_00385]|uniref:DNA-binding protein n=1 Tax=Streptomyces sp. NBC_00385 TaxID=2975733 RepID=UPI002DDC0A2E|nr:DNA-binding protein [Streptomyces sp. NBC_00385]WRZ05054.1 helix-turn-helix domain-containing protein [Streptomyces sp. NBC_00385]
MSAKTATALTEAEVLALPAMTTAEQAFAALGIGRDLGYKLIRQQEFPLTVVPIGRALRVRRVDLLAFLGLENSDAARGPALTASSERNTDTAAKQNGSAR